MNIIFSLGFKKHFYAGSFFIIITGLILFYLYENTAFYDNYAGWIFISVWINMVIIPFYLFSKIIYPNCQFNIFWK